MAISKAATISVFLATVLLYLTPLPIWAVFVISGIGVTFVYRAIKGCFNFINPMGITGAGAVVLIHYIYPNFAIVLFAGLIISVVVGMFVP
ncbi:MAG: hypothetical protein QF475_01695 [Candidatus Undinarchaeales archaeon]|jgi:hypothetical protein|nr:hypothetical protein [Candidatus Undinarchaeales archaeon]